MAFLPISNTAPNYSDYPNWWLKAYQPQTQQPLVIAIDYDGTNPASKVELNADGFPVTSGGAIIIPFIDSSYDLWLFPTGDDADNNDTTNAIRVAENIQLIPTTVLPPVGSADVDMGGFSINNANQVNTEFVNSEEFIARDKGTPSKGGKIEGDTGLSGEDRINIRPLTGSGLIQVIFDDQSRAYPQDVTEIFSPESLSFITPFTDAFVIGRYDVETYYQSWSANKSSSYVDSAASTIHREFRNTNGVVGSIFTNGTATAYNTSSDPRLKDFKGKPTDEQVTEQFDKLYDCFDTFHWKTGGDLVWGFDAHKCIDSGLDMGTEGSGPREMNIGDVYDTKTEEIDGKEVTTSLKVTPAGVDQSKAVPILIAKVKQLEERLNALS